MSTNMTPSQLFAKAAASEDAAVDAAKLSFTEEMLELMEARGISRVELARMLQVAPSRVTSMFRGLQNFTFATAVRVARALNAEFVPKLRPVEKSVRWIVYDESQTHPVFKSCGASSGPTLVCAESKRQIELGAHEVSLIA